MNSDLLDAFEEAFPDTGFVFNEDAVVVHTFAGPEVDLLVGNRNEPIVGKSVDDVFEPSIAKEIQHQIVATLDRQELQTKEYVIEVETGARSFDARMAPVATDNEEKLVAALFRDVTTRDLYAQRLDESTRILSTMQLLTQDVSRANSVPQLYSSVCQTITDSTPYQFAWIARYDDENRRLIPETDVLTQIDGIDIPESPPEDFKSHPAVNTIHNEETTVVSDIQSVSSSQHWPENPHHEGFHSIGVFPIWDDSELSNVLLVYAARPYAFSFNERLLFEELCRDIAYTKQALQANNQVREQQEQLAKRNLEWEVLNRIVRHDIRNKMAVIIGRTELLAEALTEDYSEHIEPILSSSRQVVEITKEARDVSEALATSGKIELKPVEVSGILQTEVEGVQEMYPEVTIQVSDESEGVTVEANGLVSAVFRNVLTNAVMHNPSENPEIEVSTVLNDETVVISIADNGPGFPPAVREKVFDSDLEMAGEQGVGLSAGTGHGIGLTLVVSLVSQFGGDIWVEDNDAGGSTVSIELNRA